MQQVIYLLARAQAALGDAVAVFSRESGMHVLGAARPDRARDRDGAPRGDAGSDAGRLAPPPRMRQRLLSRYFERDLARDLVAWQPDIVHFHSVHIASNVALGDHLTRAGIPYCVTVHGALFPPALRRGRLKKSAFHLLFERHYLNAAAFVHALSRDEAAAVRHHGIRTPIVVVPNGLPPPPGVARNPGALFERHPSIGGRRVFMFVGRLEPWQKGLDLLIEAFGRASLAHAALVLVGPDVRGSTRRLADLAERVGISAQVVFTGAVFGEEFADIFAAADVFVHPSRWEGVSLSVLGAAAAGKPCIVTRQADPLGALARAEAAIIVEPDTEELTSALRRAATLEGSDLQSMTTRARIAVETHFDWRITASTLADAYLTSIPSTPLEPKLSIEISES